MRITIINQQKKILINKRATKKIVLKALKALRADFEGELSVVYVNNRDIQELNLRYRTERKPTDALCFDLSDKNKFVADIVISTEKACENSVLFKTSPIWEVNLYLIHGLLHLLGFKDRTKKDRIRMHRKAIHVLNKIQ